MPPATPNGGWRRVRPTPSDPAMDGAPRELIRVGETHGGGMTYLVGLGADQLPPVAARELQNAWDAAREAARHSSWGVARAFRFERPGLEEGRLAEPVDLVLADPDACAWAGAIDARHGLGTPRGLSLCLRLLALIELIGHAAWAGALCRIRPEGAEFHPALLEAAGRLPLTREGRLDETIMRNSVGGALR